MSLSLPFFAKKEPQAAAGGSINSKGGSIVNSSSTSSKASTSSNGVSSSSSSSGSAPAPKSKGATKVEHKAVYDLAKKELKNRTEVKLTSGAKFGINYSDKSNLVSIDAERGALKVGYDFQREDAVFQYTRKSKAGTFKARQLVPGMHWEVVPSPVVELSTKLLDNSRFKDSLKLMYDFDKRFAYYTDTLKFNKKFKVRVAGDSKSTDTAICVGFKPDQRWLKSLKVTQTPTTGPLLSYKLKPFNGWKVASEVSLRARTLATSLTYKAQKGDTELMLDAALPLPGNNGKVKLLQKAGMKVHFLF